MLHLRSQCSTLQTPAEHLRVFFGMGSRSSSSFSFSSFLSPEIPTSQFSLAVKNELLKGLQSVSSQLEYFTHMGCHQYVLVPRKYTSSTTSPGSLYFGSLLLPPVQWCTFCPKEFNSSSISFSIFLLINGSEFRLQRSLHLDVDNLHSSPYI